MEELCNQSQNESEILNASHRDSLNGSSEAHGKFLFNVIYNGNRTAVLEIIFLQIFFVRSNPPFGQT